jgi:hypothetical protein
MPITTLTNRELIRTPPGRRRRPEVRSSTPTAASRASSWTSPARADAPHGSDTRCYPDKGAVGFPLDDKARVKLERVQQRRLDRQLLVRR